MRINLKITKIPGILPIILDAAERAARPHTLVRDRVAAVAELFEVDPRTVTRWADEEPALSRIIRP